MDFYMDLFIFMDYATISASAVALALSVAALVMSVRLRREAFHAREEARKLTGGPDEAESVPGENTGALSADRPV